MDARGSRRAVRLARTLLASGVSQAFIVQALPSPPPRTILHGYTLYPLTP